METFKDNKGDRWPIALTLGKVRKIRERIGIDLLNDQHYMMLLEGITDRMAYLFLLVEPQAVERNITDDEFEERLYGEGIIDQASEAFFNEAENFTQRLGQMEKLALMKRARASSKEAKTRLAKMIEDGRLDSLLENAERRIESQLQLLGSDGSVSPSLQP